MLLSQMQEATMTSNACGLNVALIIAIALVLAAPGIALADTKKANTSGKASISDMQITKHTDAASTSLFRPTVTGRHYSKTTITHRKAGNGQQ
jgi:Type VI secretion system effector, Hcp